MARQHFPYISAWMACRLSSMEISNIHGDKWSSHRSCAHPTWIGPRQLVFCRRSSIWRESATRSGGHNFSFHCIRHLWNVNRHIFDTHHDLYLDPFSAIFLYICLEGDLWI